MGLSEKDFWELTFKEFDSLCKRKSINDRRIESYSAQIACLLYNIHRGEKQPALKVEDFMSEKIYKKKVPQTAEEMKRLSKLLTAAYGGKIKKAKGKNE